MKFSLICLPLLVSGATIENALRRRQFDVFGISYSGNTLTPVSTQKLEAKIESGGVREKLVFGPFKVNAANVSHAYSGTAMKLDPDSEVISTRITGLCTDCIVLFAKSDLSQKDGSRADVKSGVYSHHILITSFGKPMAGQPVRVTCPDGKRGGFNFSPSGSGKGLGGMGGMMGGGMSHGSSAPHMRRQSPSPDGNSGLGGLLSSLIPSVFVVQGDEATPMAFATKGHSLKSGFYLSKESVNLYSEVVNYDNFKKDVYVSLDYEYIPNLSTRRKNYYDVGLGAINVEPCGSINLVPSPNKPVKYASPPWDVVADGYLIDIKPHLHDGGINMTFFVNGKEECTSKAMYTPGVATTGDAQKWETISAYSPCPNPVQIKKGDKIVIESWYDLKEHRLRPATNDHDSEGSEGMALALFLYTKPPPS